MDIKKVVMMISFGIAIVGLFVGELVSGSATAQTSSLQAAATADKEIPAGDFQRSAEILYFKKFGHNSGPKRGEEIYRFKCWMCHNEYTVKAEFGDSAPFLLLQDLYKRPRLISGLPVNDETVSEKIRNGGPGMPSYRYSLSDKDLADLASYLREMCCWDEENVPANPRYRAGPNPLDNLRKPSR